MSKTGLYINLFLQETDGLLLDGILQIFRYNIFDNNGLIFKNIFLCQYQKEFMEKKCCHGM